MLNWCLRFEFDAMRLCWFCLLLVAVDGACVFVGLMVVLFGFVIVLLNFWLVVLVLLVFCLLAVYGGFGFVGGLSVCVGFVYLFGFDYDDVCLLGVVILLLLVFACLILLVACACCFRFWFCLRWFVWFVWFVLVLIMVSCGCLLSLLDDCLKPV